MNRCIGAPTDWAFGDSGNSVGRRRLLYLTASADDTDFASDFPRIGWDVEAVRDPVDALGLIRKQGFLVGLVHTDYVLEMPNLRHWQRLYAASTDMQWIGLCSNDPKEDPALGHAIRRYLFDYHMLPVDMDRLAVILSRAHGMAELNCSETASAFETGQPGGIVHSSAVMVRLLGRAAKAAKVNAPVLILGESGTGKELVARAIHEASPRASGPFVVVNFGAMPETLVESELFGYERGAFTGANRRKIGRVELARGGTVFFDEIGDLRPDPQASLLRFLQEGTIDRLGGHESIAVDARVIAATHVDLASAVGRGRFREDLFYRLNVVQLDMPPLRERGPDIGVLARHFYALYAEDGKPDLRGFSEALMDAIYNHE